MTPTDPVWQYYERKRLEAARALQRLRDAEQDVLEMERHWGTGSAQWEQACKDRRAARVAYELACYTGD